MYIRKKTSNGIRMVVEKLPEIRSATIGIWVKAGSVYENSENNGISHFIEHMMFKGTVNRSYKDIANEMDRIGGQINAFTSKEFTCYYAKVIDEKQDIAIDILTDMLVNSVFPEKEIEKEKGVVIEEIQMNEDDPEDVSYETMGTNFFKGTELSKTILGPEKNIQSISKQTITEYMSNYYTPENIVVSAVGNIDVDKLCDKLESVFSKVECNKINKKICEVPENWSPQKNIIKIKKNIEQINICMGLRAYSYSNLKKYSMLIISSLFGGSMSSRLFQKIREEQGAAYSVYSNPSSYAETGLLSIYAGTSIKNVQKVTDGIIKEINTFSMTERELSEAKEHFRGQYILSQESMSSKMMALGKSVIMTDDIITENQILELLSSVTMDDIKEACEYMFNTDFMTSVYVGKIDKMQLDETVLK